MAITTQSTYKIGGGISEESQIKQLRDAVDELGLMVQSLLAELKDIRYATPAKPREGMFAVADGTTWNPGSGAGLYRYTGGAWVILDSGGGGVINSIQRGTSAVTILAGSTFAQQLIAISAVNMGKSFVSVGGFYGPGVFSPSANVYLSSPTQVTVIVGQEGIVGGNTSVTVSWEVVEFA